jgi:hypothetical protein
MGSFANSTEGMLYQEKYCDRCVHDAQNDCPIWNAHLMFNGSEAPETVSILQMLIPSHDGINNDECSMFTLDAERAQGEKVDEQYMLWHERRGDGT